MAIAVALAACGSSDDTTSTTSKGSKAATGSAVKIGVVAPKNVPGLSQPEIEAVARQAATYFNKRGGLGGHPIEIDYCNDMLQPNQTAACAQKLVSDKVVAVAGGSVVLGDVFDPIVLKAGIPVVGKVPISSGDFRDPNIYNFSGGSFFSYQGLSAYSAHKVGPVSIVHLDTPVSDLWLGAMKSASKAAGGTLAKIVSVSPTQSDFAPIVAASQANGAKGVILLMGHQQSTAYLQAAKSAGLTSRGFTIMAAEALVAADRTILGPDAARFVYADVYPPYPTSNLPLMRTFRQILEEGGGTGPLDVDVQSTGSFAVFLALEAIAKIVDHQGLETLTADTLTAALNKTKDLDLGGVVPAWTPNAAGPKSAPRVPSTASWYVRYASSGAPVLISPDAIPLAAAISGQFS